MNDRLRGMKAVYSVVERNDRSYWTKVGVGFVNKDDSISIQLEAIPLSGKLIVRDWEDRSRPGAPAKGPQDRQERVARETRPRGAYEKENQASAHRDIGEYDPETDDGAF